VIVYCDHLSPTEGQKKYFFVAHRHTILLSIYRVKNPAFQAGRFQPWVSKWAHELPNEGPLRYDLKGATLQRVLAM
jgi:hypothetical protein